MSVPTIDEIEETFSLMDDWQDRYQYIIELGDALPEMAEADHNDATFVEGCVSRVWIKADMTDQGTLSFSADSDAHLVKGLIVIILSIFKDKTAAEILNVPVETIFQKLDLESHITPNRRGGLHAMVQRVRGYAQLYA